MEEALLKFLENTYLSMDTLSAVVDASFESVFKLGIWLEVLPKNLIVFQNCLLPNFDIFFKWPFFDCLRSCTTSFLRDVYLDHRVGLLVALAFL